LEQKPRFKEASNEIRLLYSSLFWNFNKKPNPISRLVLSFFLLLPLVFSRLDVCSWLFFRLDAKPNLSRSKCFPLIRLDLALHIVPRIRYLGFKLKGEGSLDYDGGLVCLQVQTNFDTIINRQQAPFYGAVAGEQVIKIQSSIAFVNIFLLLS
jgi:hypothetical protein